MQIFSMGEIHERNKISKFISKYVNFFDVCLVCHLYNQ